MNLSELKALGLTEADVLNKLVEKLCERFLGDEDDYKSEFEQKVEAGIRKRVDEVLDETVTKHILPSVAKTVDGICLEETNKWGEKKGTKLTFVEFLVQRVDSYIREEVDYWNIEQAMTKALGDVNSSVRKGLEEAVNIALKNIKVTVNTKVEAQ